MLLDREVAADPDERDQLVRRARESAHGLLQLVDSVLDLGKLDAGKVPVDVEVVDLARWAAAQRDRERMPLHDGVAVAWRVLDALPAIRTDPAKLRIVLDNLVNNAIKFTVRGTITVAMRHVAAAGTIELRVEDTGPGIAKRELARIFEAFHQTADGKDHRHGGVGLGLAIVDRYVRLLGGTIAVDSTPGVGTTFTVTVPCDGPASGNGTPRARTAA
jgi:hypothetical protein